MTAGSVDQEAPTSFASVPTCACGYTLDLAGGSPGTITQTLDTSPGNYYNVSVYMSGNYNSAYRGAYTVRITFGSTTWNESYSYSASWRGPNPEYDLRWKIVSATAESTVLEMADITPTAGPNYSQAYGP